MISQFWDVGYGQLYPALKMLEEEGYIIGTPAKSEKGPDRIVYAITTQWKRIYTIWNPPEIVFWKSQQPSTAIKRIEAFQKQHEEDLQLIRSYKANLESVFQENRDHLYYYLTVLFGEHIYKAYLKWADESLAFINKNIVSEEDKKGIHYEALENS